MGIRTRETKEYFPKTKSPTQTETTESGTSTSTSATVENLTKTEEIKTEDEDKSKDTNPAKKTPPAKKAKGKASKRQKKTNAKVTPQPKPTEEVPVEIPTTTTAVKVDDSPIVPPPVVIPVAEEKEKAQPKPKAVVKATKTTKKASNNKKSKKKPEEKLEKVEEEKEKVPLPVEITITTEVPTATTTTTTKDKPKAKPKAKAKSKAKTENPPLIVTPPLAEVKEEKKEEVVELKVEVEETNKGSGSGNIIKNGILKVNKKMKKGIRNMMERTNKILERSRNCKKPVINKTKPRPIPARVSARLCVRKNSGDHEGVLCNNQPLRTVELIKRPLELRDPATKLLYLASLSLYPKADPESDTTPIVIISEELPSVGGKKPKLRSMELPLLPNWRNNALYHSTSRTIEMEEETPALLLSIAPINSPDQYQYNNQLGNEANKSGSSGKKKTNKKRKLATTVAKSDMIPIFGEEIPLQNGGGFNDNDVPLLSLDQAKPTKSQKRSKAQQQKKDKMQQVNADISAPLPSDNKQTHLPALAVQVPHINGLNIQPTSEPKKKKSTKKPATFRPDLNGQYFKSPLLSSPEETTMVASEAPSGLTFTGLFSGNSTTFTNSATTISRPNNSFHSSVSPPLVKTTGGFPSIPNVTFTSISYPTFTASNNNGPVNFSKTASISGMNNTDVGMKESGSGDTVKVVKKKRKSLETIIKEIPKAKAQKMCANINGSSPILQLEMLQLPINFSGSQSSNPILEGLMKNPIKKRSLPNKGKSAEEMQFSPPNDFLQYHHPISMSVPLQPAPEIPNNNNNNNNGSGGGGGGNLMMKEITAKPTKKKSQKKSPQFQLPLPLPIPLPHGLLSYGLMLANAKAKKDMEEIPKPKKARKPKPKKISPPSDSDGIPQTMTGLSIQQQQSVNSYPSIPYLPSHLEAYFKPMTNGNGNNSPLGARADLLSPPLQLSDQQSQALDLCVKVKAKPARKRQKKVQDANNPTKSLLKPLNVEDDTPLNLVVNRTNNTQMMNSKSNSEEQERNDSESSLDKQQENLENVKQMLARLHTKIQPAINGVQLITIE